MARLQRKIIAIDLDDTLATTIEATIAYAAKKLCINLEIGDISSTKYWQQYGVSDKDAIALVHGYNLEGHPGLKPLQGAAETTRKLAKKYNLYVVTARDHQFIETTKVWLNIHFPGIFEEVIFSGNPWLSKEARSKGDICLEIGADWLIDDSVSTVTACSAQGVNALLFGGHPWHLQVAKHPHIYNVKDWQEVEEYFDAQN